MNDKLMQSFKRRFIASLAALMILPAVSLFGQEEEDDEEEVQRVEVTGSRIKRIDLETPAPVLRITREELDATGFATVGDALRALPFNSGQSLNSVDAGTSFTPGVSALNLRGLGNNNVLVLINGRRAAPFGASGFNGFQTVFDFNSVPSSAIDSIEILKDGASALYGSDAVSGVVNIQLRKDFEGVNAQVGIGAVEGSDRLEKSLFLMVGASTNKTSIVTTFDYFTADAISTSEFGFSNTADLRFNDRSTENFFQPIPGTDGKFEIDWRSSRSFPARFRLPVDANGVAAGSLVSFGSGPTTDPDTGDIVPISAANPDEFGNSPGFYNFAGAQEGNATNLYPEFEGWGFYTSITHEVFDWLSLDAEFSFRRSNSVGWAAPAPLSSLSENGDGPTGGIIIPAENPNNPFDEDIVDFAWRMHSSGPRFSNVRADYPRVVLALNGDIGFSWSWDAGIMWTQSEYSNDNLGTVFDSLVQDALNGVVIDGELLYANPFGPEDPRISDYYTGENPVVGKWEVLSYDAEASGELFDLPAGPVAMAIGLEFREEAFEDYRTIANETGDIVGGSEGNGVQGDRDVFGAFVELNVPLHSTLEVQAAARYEEYSDFGDTTKPKIAAKFRPLDWLMIRGSYGQSFKAPDLPFLFAERSVSFTSSAQVDPRRPDDTPVQLKTVATGNPGLGPEETDTTYAGITIEPGESLFGGLLDGLVIAVDWFEFDQENLITRVSATDVLALEASGDLLPDQGEVVRLAPVAGDPNPVGVISEVRNRWFNAPSFVYTGIDMSVAYSFETENLGNFRAQVIATQILDRERPDLGTSDDVGTYLIPEWRASGTLAWNKGDWAASVFVNWIDGYESDFSGFFPDVPSHFLVNPQVSFDGFWDLDITLGVRNVFDKEPPRDYSNSIGFEAGVYNPTPRSWYLRVNRDF